jgi:hypothetical protein
VAAGHRLATRASVVAADLRGERLLVPSPPGTPYTDLLLAHFDVTPVESRVTGTGVILVELGDAVAVMPDGTAGDCVSLPLEDFTLPLFVLWPTGRPSPAARRLTVALAP